MIYLGKDPVGISDTLSIDWDAVANGGSIEIMNNVVLSDSVTEIKASAFRGLPIKTIIGNGVSEIKSMAFYNCVKLISCDFPSIKVIGSEAFSQCSNLQNFTFNSIETLGGSSFRGTKIQYVVAPNLSKLNTDVFYGLSSLRCLDIGNKTIENATFSGYVFDHTSACITILRYNYVLPAVNGWFYQGCWLKNTSTPGTLYVWEDLIEDYQNHAIWGPLLASNNNQILPIEGSIYETQYGDGTPIT